MSILAFEGSGQFLSISVLDSGVMRSRRIALSSNLCEIILKEADELLGGRIADVEEILVGSGPGSFTSLRIVFSAVKGLSLALSIPVKSLSSLALLAMSYFDFHGRGDGSVIALPISDAKKGRLYCAAYDAGGSCLSGPHDLPLELFLKKAIALLSCSSSANPQFKKAALVSDDPSLLVVAKDLSGIFSFELLENTPLASTLIRHRDECSVLQAFQGPDYVRQPDAKPMA